jgi:hypothetical protein
MAKLTVKDSVRFKEFTPAMITMLVVLFELARSIDYVDEVVITSANDSTHAATSRHYSNEALDIRVRNFTDKKQLAKFIIQLEDSLGAKFTVIYEMPGTPNAHIHVQPKKGTTYA